MLEVRSGGGRNERMAFKSFWTAVVAIAEMYNEGRRLRLLIARRTSSFSDGTKAWTVRGSMAVPGTEAMLIYVRMYNCSYYIMGGCRYCLVVWWLE